MPTLNAECSLDLGCPIDEFTAFCDAHPDRTVVVYANTSAAVKARADWVVTSSIAVELIEHLDSPGRKSSGRPIVTGKLCTKQTGADVLCWQGACIVHDEFKTQALTRMRGLYPTPRFWCTRNPRSPSSTWRMPSGQPASSFMLRKPCHTSSSLWRPIAVSSTRCSRPCRKNVARSADRRRRGDLPKLRALPVDGDEWAQSDCGGAGKRWRSA